MKTEVAIVGAGSAGLAALREVQKYTEDVLLINDGPWGTTCARVGCMPSKVLIEAANAFQRRASFAEFGIRGADGLTVDLPAVLARVRRLRDDFVAGTLKTGAALGARAISGRARLLDARRLVVNGEQIEARAIILAPGSAPVVPPPWRALGERLLTTDTLFEQADLPRRIAVIGLGAIGVEMAQALARLGLEVHGFGRGAPAGLSDEKVSAAATAILAEEFALHLGADAEVSLDNEAVRVRAGEVSVTVDAVLASLGRRPNLKDLGLDALGVELDARGLPPLDPTTLQIERQPVFLAGDANGARALLHEAADEGHIAGLNAVRLLKGETPACYARRTPLGIVFAEPNIAVIGRRHRELPAGGCITGEVDFRRQGRARAGQRNQGLLRIYAEASSGHILGAELCAPAGEHLAHLIALAIDQQLTVADFLRLPFYHPVLEEGLRTALRMLAAQLPTRPESDLPHCGHFGAIGAEALE